MVHAKPRVPVSVPGGDILPAVKPRSSHRKAFVGLLSVLLLGCPGRNKDSTTAPIADEMGDKDFAAIAPPSRLVDVGAIIRVRSETGGTLKYDVVCGTDTAVGFSAQPSPTATETLTRAKNHWTETAVGKDGIARVEAEYGSVASVEMTIANPQVSEITLAGKFVVERTEACHQALAYAMDNDWDIALVNQSYSGDIAVRATFSGEVSATAKAEILQALGVDLGITGGQVTESQNEVVGESLVWGVRFDRQMTCPGFQPELQERCIEYVNARSP